MPECDARTLEHLELFLFLLLELTGAHSNTHAALRPPIRSHLPYPWTGFSDTSPGPKDLCRPSAGGMETPLRSDIRKINIPLRARPARENQSHTPHRTAHRSSYSLELLLVVAATHACGQFGRREQEGREEGGSYMLCRVQVLPRRLSRVYSARY